MLVVTITSPVLVSLNILNSFGRFSLDQTERCLFSRKEEIVFFSSSFLSKKMCATAGPVEILASIEFNFKISFRFMKFDTSDIP